MFVLLFKINKYVFNEKNIIIFFLGGSRFLFFYFIKLNLTSFVPLGAANGLTEAAPFGQTLDVAVTIDLGI